MEIKIDREILLKAMSRVQGILEKKSHMPILSTVLLKVDDNGLELSATDLEISFRDTYNTDVIQPGSITISGGQLLAIARETNAAKIHILEKENNWVYISDGNARYNLSCLPADEFPDLTEPKQIVMVEIDGKILSEMIAKTIYAADMEGSGAFKLSGVFMEKVDKEGEHFLRMVATDGHKLSMIDKKLPNIERVEIEKGVMIPKKGLTELNKLSAEETISVGLDQSNLVARKEEAIIVVRLLITKFPDYRNIIPSEQKENIITINRTPLLEAIRRMMILTRGGGESQGVKLKIEGGYLELACVNPDMGNAEEKVEIKYAGEPIEIGFNPKYFINALSSMDSDIIQLNIKDEASPCLITGDKDEGFLGLIMPMKV